MTAIHSVTVLEHCRISPPPGTATAKSLQLTRFDLEVPWTELPPVHILYLYEHPISKVDFVQTIVSKLKNSLSLALKHFYPMAGNILLYSTTTKKVPELRYVEGDSVAVTIAESVNDLGRLSGDGPRKAEDFYCLIPHLAEPTRTSEAACIAPVFALQLTLFPNSGFSLGVTFSHVAFDGSTTLNFRKAWALINRFEGEGAFLESQLVPYYDRTMIIKDDCISIHRESLAQFSLRPQNKVRATFFMSQDQIQRLKDFVRAKRPTLAHVSSLTVAIANVWSCLAKAVPMDDDKMEGLVIPADCRARLAPPVPATYFGNCLITCFVIAKIEDLRTNAGLLVAVELIGESIMETMRTVDVREAVRKLFEGPQRKFGVAGSPKFDTYDLDFGWGRPKKCEYISIDYGASNDYKSSISVSRSRDSDNLEIGVCLPVTQMDAFARHFDDTINLRF